jgi:hypothetical protein
MVKPLANVLSLLRKFSGKVIDYRFLMVFGTFRANKVVSRLKSSN